MRKSLIVSLLVLVLTLGMSSVSFAQGDLYLVVDGKKVETDAPCFIENNRTLVPVRFIGESLGYNVAWDAGARRVTITNAKADAAVTRIELTINSNKARVYDAAGKSKEVVLGTAAKIAKDRTFVPVRFIGESFGTAVDWDGTNRVVIIGDKSLYKAEEFAKLRKAEAPNPVKEPGRAYATESGVYLDDTGKLLMFVMGGQGGSPDYVVTFAKYIPETEKVEEIPGALMGKYNANTRELKLPSDGKVIFREGGAIFVLPEKKFIRFERIGDEEGNLIK